jgi:hypothetical protein
MAVDAFMSDGRDRGNTEATMYKRRNEFEKGLLGYCREKGIRFLSEIGLHELREWRSTWKVQSLSRQKRQGRVIGFLWFCERGGWYPRNHAADMTRKDPGEGSADGLLPARRIRRHHRCH